MSVEGYLFGGHPLLVPSIDAEAAGDVHLAEQVARGDRWLLESYASQKNLQHELGRQRAGASSPP